MAFSKLRWRPPPWMSSSAIDTAPMMTPPHTRGTPKSRWRASAPPITSARSVAAATISACAQKAMRPAVGSLPPSREGRDSPVTSPSLADRYWTTMAARFEATSTHTSRYPYRAPAVMLAATLPGST